MKAIINKNNDHQTTRMMMMDIMKIELYGGGMLF